MIQFSKAPLRQHEKINAFCLGAVLFAVLLYGMLQERVHPYLPVCAFKRLTGLPCPSCGLSRSLQAAVEGDLSSSVAFHPLGLLLFSVVLLLFIHTLLRLLTGTRLFTLSRQFLRRVFIFSIVLYLSVWVFRLIPLL